MDAPSHYLVERYAGYVLLDRIGQGGMAEVFRAVAHGAEGFRRLCVVKRILPQYSSDPDFVEMFVAEARLCALLHHPNVVHVIEFGQEEGAYYLVMEYLHGPTVLRVLQALSRTRQHLPPAMAAFIAREAAAGLDYAHKLHDEEGRPRNIVHRDVSPSNLVLPLTGGVKILDFGIAKVENEARAARTRDGVVKGKFAYTAPEQVSGGPVDHRADVFSLGVVLWELLTRKRLFHGENEFATVKLLLERPVPPPSAMRPGISPQLDAIVLRALERERSRRYPTAEAMGADLENALHALRYRAAEMPRLLADLCGAELPAGGENAIPPDVLARVRALGSGAVDAPVAGVSTMRDLGIVVEATAPTRAGGPAADAPDGDPPAMAPVPAPARGRSLRGRALGGISIGLAAGIAFIAAPLPGRDRPQGAPALSASASIETAGPIESADAMPVPSRAVGVDVPTGLPTDPPNAAAQVPSVPTVAAAMEATIPPASPRAGASARRARRAATRTRASAPAPSSKVRDAIPSDPFAE